MSAPLRMPFGKHKGELIENLPTDYLRWMVENFEFRGDVLRQEFENQLALRDGHGVVRRLRHM